MTVYQTLGLDLDERKDPKEWRLAFQLLQIMIILGFPVEISVLARVPSIAKYAQEDEKEDIAAIEEKLRALLESGLVGAILPRTTRGNSPKPEAAPDCYISVDDIADARRGYRFVLHPRFKQHLLSNISHKGYDTHLTNTFVFSLYASQPTDVPMLSNDTIHVVDETLDALTQAWRLQNVKLTLGGEQLVEPDSILGYLRAPCEEEYFFDAKTPKGAFARASSDMPLCYRASYGILRQMRPFAVIARTDLSENQQNSRFEETGDRIRDLIFGMESSRRARGAVQKYIAEKYPDADKEIKRAEIEQQCLNTYGPLAEGEHAIYSHELAWLWNERGVLALAQGRLYDAIPYLRRAKRELTGDVSSNDDNDHSIGHEGGRGRGPATKRVDLNLAVTAIERGHLRRAERELKNIIDTNKVLMGDNAPQHSFEVNPVAEGYRAILAHLSGNFKSAKELYESSLEELAKLRRHRAVSIFSQAYADFLMKESNLEKARYWLRRAETAAQAMKQLDQTHCVMVCKARYAALWGDHIERIKSRDALDKVLEYARSTKLMRLECEALTARSSIELEEKNFADAGRNAAMALAIATRHGMRIRRIAAKITLAEAFIKMGAHESEAKNLLDRCEHRAQVCNYILALQRIQNIRMSQ